MASYTDPTANDFPKDYKKSGVDERVLLRSQSVRTKMYGKDVREAMAQGIEIGSAVANEAKTTVDEIRSRFNNQIVGSTNDNEVIDARQSTVKDKKFSVVKDRLEEEEQDTKNVTDEVVAARTNSQGDAYDTLSERLDAQESDFTNSMNAKLTQMSDSPEAFANLNALKTKYPTGKTGIFVTVDDGHKYIWANSTWTDAGVYQSTAIGERTITNAMIKDGVKMGRIVAGSPVVLSVINRTLTLSKIYRLFVGAYSVKPNKAAYTFKLSDDQSGFYLYYDSATGDISVTSDALPDTGTLLGWLNLSGSASTYDISASSVTSDVENPYVKPIDRIPFTSNGNTPINISTADRTMKVDVSYFNVYYANEAFKIANTGTIDLDTGTTATFLYFDTATQAFVTKDSTNGLLPPTYIYLGAIDWAYPLNSKLYFPATFDGVDIFRLRHSDKYAELVAGYVIEVDFENKTMTLDKSGYASLQFEDSAYNIRKYNKGNIDISAGGASMSFLFVDVSTNKIQAYSARNAAPISALYLGWIDWANYDWNVHFKLKIAGANRDTKSAYKFGRGAVTFFGDSITVANNVDRPWTAIVANDLNTSATKNGWSGTTYTSGDREHSAVDRVDEIKNQDLVVVEFGVNDFHYGRPLGQFGDTDTTKFYGALDFVYNKLITNNPTAKFVIMTPMKNHGYKDAPDSFTQNSDGHYQIDYVNAIKQVADKYSLPVLDMYANSGISAMNETHNKKYLFDGLHPNQEGSFIVASKVIGFINSQI